MATKTAQHEGEREEDANGADERLALISSQLAVQGQQIRAILEILTAEPISDGPSLAAQVVELIARLDTQTRYLKELGVAVVTLGRELPLHLVAAIDDNLDIPRRNGGDPDGGGNGRA